LHCGTIEIRPAADISGMMRERETFSEFAVLHCFSYKRSRLSKRCNIDDEAIFYVAFQQPFVNISPVKRACIDLSGQLPGGRQTESNPRIRFVRWSGCQRAFILRRIIGNSPTTTFTYCRRAAAACYTLKPVPRRFCAVGGRVDSPRPGRGNKWVVESGPIPGRTGESGCLSTLRGNYRRT